MQANTILEPRTAAAADLRELAAKMEGTCVTIYLAGHKAGSGTRPMRVRLRRLLTEAEQVLEQRGILPTDRESLLAPLRERAASTDLNGGHAEGLVLIRSTSRFEQYSLPWEVNDLVVVGGYPFLIPMAWGIETGREFLLLALSLKNTRLLECGPLYQRPLSLPDGVAKGLEEFEGFDRRDHGRGVTGAGVTFGRDTAAEKQHLYLHDFCRALDRGLHPLLERRGLPLVLAGATAELAAYRSVNRYAQLTPEAIEGSPDAGWTDADLAGKGRIAARAFHSATALRAQDQYGQAGAGKRSTEMTEILRAAAEGRLLHLFLAGNGAANGDVDRILGRVLLSGACRNEHENLANAAVIEAWRHGGEVWMLDEPLGDGAALAAAFCW
jgi:hypothetical protein